MDAIKALCRSLLVMLLLWMVSLLVYYWPLPEEATAGGVSGRADGASSRAVGG